MVAVQSSVGRDERGLVTGTAMFSRSLGSAVGVGALGAIVTAVTAGRLDAGTRRRCAIGCPPARTPPASPCVRTSRRTSWPYVRAALAAATHDLFVVLAVVALATVAALLLMPRRQRGRPSGEADDAARPPDRLPAGRTTRARGGERT